jgi:hypothetical protein
VGDQGQGACSEGAASPDGTGQQFRDRGQRNPRIEASASLPRNASYDKSTEYSVERPLHLSVERIAYFTEPVLPWAAPPNPELARNKHPDRVGQCPLSGAKRTLARTRNVGHMGCRNNAGLQKRKLRNRVAVDRRQ